MLAASQAAMSTPRTCSTLHGDAGPKSGAGRGGGVNRGHGLPHARGIWSKANLALSASTRGSLYRYSLTDHARGATSTTTTKPT